MIQTLEQIINPTNQIKETFGDYFYQIGQLRYQTNQMGELSINYRNLTKDLDELGKICENKTQNNINYKSINNKWNCKTQLIQNKNNIINTYINRIETIGKNKITTEQKNILYKYNSKNKQDKTNAIKLAGILTGNLKISILEQIEELIEN